MSAVRDYLIERREAEGEKGWLRRKPRETHPEILALVREAKEQADLFYDDDVNRYVNERVGDLPPHEHHPANDPLVAQLGHETYIAKQCLRDEYARARVVGLIEEGYAALAETEVEDGGRYTAKFGTVYVGRSEPDYGQGFPVRAVVTAKGVELRPKGTRKQVYRQNGHVLIREGWEHA